MIKKASIVFSAVLYFVVSSGVVFYSHSCMGKVKSTQLFQVEKECCCGDMKGMMDCCEDEQQLIKLDDDHSPVNHQFTVSNDWIITKANFAEIELAFPSMVVGTEVFLDLPPPPSRQVRLINCSLTYYG